MLWAFYCGAERWSPPRGWRNWMYCWRGKKSLLLGKASPPGTRRRWTAPAASTAALTVYDMCKAIQRDIIISDIRLLEKTGGIHGDFVREEH